LNPHSALGACYYEHEGQVNPFSLMRAYIHQAQNYGLATHLGTKVTKFATRSGRIQSAITTDGEFYAASVILCTGAWTPSIGRMLERDWDISHVHGQALVTEAAPHLRLRNHLASAAFFEAAHDEEGNSTAESAVLAISQTAGGHFLLGEAAKNTEDLGSASTAVGQAAIADLSAAYFPPLRGLNTLRGWAAPVAFTNDGLPFLGPVDDIDGLILATAFKSTVIVTPLVGQVIADIVVNDYTNVDISPFSPDR
jgi:glycine/D-amino acid oxidase-like deaminating enzyme